MRRIVSILFIALACSMFNVQYSILKAQYVPSNENLKARAEFQDKKFGIFLHWGVYAMMGQGEWVMNNRNINYEEYAKILGGFYPSQYNAEEWVKAFKEAGVNYITITSRHHDGFSMFYSKASEGYNVVEATPYGKDVIKELADACAKYGITLNFYYSHLDWHRLDYPLGNTGRQLGRPTDRQNWQSYYKFMNDQLTELLTQYGKIGAIWFDGVWDHDGDAQPFDWQLEEQYALIHRLQPSCLVGNNHHKNLVPGEDIQIFERDLPGQNTAGYSGKMEVSTSVPLESCQTMSDSWGFNITDTHYKSAKELIQMLVHAAGLNANLLLNIGPQADGKLPAEALKRLKEIGEWTSQYGETIYGTRSGLVTPRDWGVTTQKGNKLYVHILKLADKGLFLPITDHKLSDGRLFKDGTPVKIVKSKAGYLLELSEVPTDIDTVVELTVD
ncbi:MAG: alpha-L-fucosidase [Bacteroidaceae bacterium]|nr:alpha-L-fucosidase [Bacteroidaceae bacterium]